MSIFKSKSIDISKFNPTSVLSPTGNLSDSNNYVNLSSSTVIDVFEELVGPVTPGPLLTVSDSGWAGKFQEDLELAFNQVVSSARLGVSSIVSELKRTAQNIVVGSLQGALDCIANTKNSLLGSIARGATEILGLGDKAKELEVCFDESGIGGFSGLISDINRLIHISNILDKSIAGLLTSCIEGSFLNALASIARLENLIPKDFLDLVMDYSVCLSSEGIDISTKLENKLGRLGFNTSGQWLMKDLSGILDANTLDALRKGTDAFKDLTGSVKQALGISQPPSIMKLKKQISNSFSDPRIPF